MKTTKQEIERVKLLAKENEMLLHSINISHLMFLNEFTNDIQLEYEEIYKIAEETLAQKEVKDYLINLIQSNINKKLKDE